MHTNWWFRFYVYSVDFIQFTLVKIPSRFSVMKISMVVDGVIFDDVISCQFLLGKLYWVGLAALCNFDSHGDAPR